MTKVSKQLIMKKIKNKEKTNLVDETGDLQHGFIQGRSTTTTGLTIQTILAHNLDQNEFTLMLCIDLSAAFNLVNIKLLIKRLKIVGLPSNILELINGLAKDCFM